MKWKIGDMTDLKVIDSLSNIDTDSIFNITPKVN